MILSFVRKFVCTMPAMALAFPAAASVSAPPAPEAGEAETAPPTPGAPSTETAVAPPPDTAAEEMDAIRGAARLQEFDKLRSQGQTTDFPGVNQTLTKDLGGFRSWLYDRKLYFRGVSSNTLTQDLSGNGTRGGQQTYTGQKLTATQSNELRLSWKIGGSGDDITQINVGGLFNLANWREVGPSGAKFSNLNIYSSFFGKAVEVKAGFGSNISDFVGIFSGGNPILASGLAASIPLSTGMSGGTAVAPSISLQLNPGRGFYSKSAVQRSLVPEGMSADAARAGAGLKFNRRGAKALYIQEFGLLRPASQQSRQMWFRAGGTYNTTLYDRLDGQGKERNWSAYALADYQIFQPDRKKPYRGIYMGASALFAAEEVNVYTRSLEARVYALGMIPGRPTDQMTFTIGHNRFSRTGARAIEAAGGKANRDQFSVGALYAFHARDGLFISPSLTYIRNPSFVGDFKPAINLATSVTVLF